LCLLKLEKEGNRCLKGKGYVLPLKSEILMDPTLSNGEKFLLL
jgi:hypothetical protein